MEQFEHVMVLLSIVVGLGIAHILLGIGGIFDRRSGHGAPLKLSIAHAAWLAFLLTWMSLFWWWEYQLYTLVAEWTFGLYVFLLLYSIILFLLAVTLVPRSWHGVDDLDAYLLSKRRWFFPLLLLATFVDIVDSYLKGGWDYVLGSGFWGLGFALLTIPVAVVGMRSESKTVHAALAVVFLILQVAVGFEMFPALGG